MVRERHVTAGLAALFDLLQRGASADLKARLIVDHGVHPDAAAELALDPEGSARRIESLIDDIYTHLRGS